MYKPRRKNNSVNRNYDQIQERRVGWWCLSEKWNFSIAELEEIFD